MALSLFVVAATFLEDIQGISVLDHRAEKPADKHSVTGSVCRSKHSEFIYFHQFGHVKKK